MDKTIDKNKLSEELARIRSGKIVEGNQVFYVLASGDVVIVKEGHKGYCKTDWNWGNIPHAEAMELAKKRNDNLGICQETAEAIIIFSMFG